LSVSPDIYKQRFGGIVKLCSSLKSTDYWTFRVFNEEEDDLLDTVRDFSSAMYDNFHHLLEIIEAFGSLCENEDIGFIYSTLVTQSSRHIVTRSPDVSINPASYNGLESIHSDDIQAG
jgi:hypothetical protein